MNASTENTPSRRFFRFRRHGAESVFVFPPDVDADGAVIPTNARTGTRYFPDSGASIMGAFWSLSEMPEARATEITEAEAREILGDKFPEATN